MSDCDCCKMPQSADKRGYTGEEIRAAVTPEEHKWLMKWLCGQTCALSESGKVLSYGHDIERGLRLLRHGEPTFFD